MNWVLGVAGGVMALVAVLAFVVKWFRGTARTEQDLEAATSVVERERAERERLEAHEIESRRMRNEDFEQVLVLVLTPGAAADLLRAEVSSEDPRTN